MGRRDFDCERGMPVVKFEMRVMNDVEPSRGVGRSVVVIRDKMGELAIAFTGGLAIGGDGTADSVVITEAASSS